MEIKPPTVFTHAGRLPARLANADPRHSDFEHDPVIIDLRECEFVYPAAMIWCVVYGSLAVARGATCQLLVPSNLAAAADLTSAGLLEMCRTMGISVETPDADDIDSGVLLPLTRFQTAADGEDLANKALDKLHTGTDLAAGLRTLIAETFGELANNAAEHSGSEIGSFGMIEFFDPPQGGRRFTCAVGDGGVGIRATLGRNPQLRALIPYDWVAIERASRERISGTAEPTRGIGLFGIAEDMRASGRSLILHSGIGMLQINENVESSARRTTLFPGTLAAATIRV